MSDVVCRVELFVREYEVISKDFSSNPLVYVCRYGDGDLGKAKTEICEMRQRKKTRDGRAL